MAWYTVGQFEGQELLVRTGQDERGWFAHPQFCERLEAWQVGRASEVEAIQTVRSNYERGGIPTSEPIPANVPAGHLA